MKKILMSIICCCLSLGCLAQTKMNLDKTTTNCKEWKNQNFRKGKTPPFAFDYDGICSDRFITKWHFSAEELSADKCNEQHTKYSWKDASTGLEVCCVVKTFDDYNAIEWVLNFKNSSEKNSPQISNIRVVNVAPSSSKDGGWKLFYSNGSTASKDDFMAKTKSLSIGENFEMSPYGGRSSSHAFPFFNVLSPAGSGVVFAIGWTGTWLANIARPTKEQLNVSTGMKFLDTYLLPDEEIRTPSTAMLLWNGEDRMDGQNSFRRFLLAHHHPSVNNGEPADFPISNSFNYRDPYPCNEYTCMTASYAKALVDRYEQFNLVQEVFWLDAGWYEGADDWQHGYNWANTVGNWEVDKERFPNGMKEISDAVHGVGAKFMVWFEPERVNRSSKWAHEHPEFLLNATGEPANIVEGPTEHSHIVDLGNPKALRWMTDNVKKIIRENGIDYYRQDYNLDPEGFWMANDKPGRRGICEIRYICGLYQFWDELREEFPELLIDNCASGGRRIDLETTSRSAPMWRTDYNYGEPNGAQSHTYGLCQWLPIHGTGVDKPDVYSFRSGFSWSFIANVSITSPTTNLVEMHKRYAELYSVRSYFKEDFYPLTGYGDTTGSDIWIAYQLCRPSDRSGYIMAFRREDCQTSQCEVMLRGLSKTATYIIEDQDTGDREELSGKTLSEKFTITATNPRSSKLYKYWEK